MLRKLVINNWVHVSSELVLEDGKMSCTSLEGEGSCWEVGSNAGKWGDHV